MNLLLKRNYTAKGTIGTLIHNGQLICFVLEDPKDTDGKKDAGVECIPEGTYNILPAPTGRWSKRINDIRAAAGAPNESAKLYKSMPEFIGIPRLQGVSNYEGIDIHPGNSVADTEGCLLPALSVATAGGAITSSQSVLAFIQLYSLIMPALKAGGLSITIKGA